MRDRAKPQICSRATEDPAGVPVGKDWAEAEDIWVPRRGADDGDGCGELAEFGVLAAVQPHDAGVVVVAWLGDVGVLAAV